MFQLSRFALLATTLFQLAAIGPLHAAEEEEDKAPFSAKTFAGLKLRSIGPALMSGRIADIAIHPQDSSIRYVAVGSGGIWKTANAGVTWTPIFDKQSSYSIGCVTIDPNDSNVIWAGTGENVGGRHVGFGDGIYRSIDGGNSWEKRGLEGSEHIGKIIVHPGDSNTLWVAAEGPLWSKGGQRGLYKSVDGGESWRRTLGDDEWTGVTDILLDPRDPDLLYAATWQRHRTVAAYVGGGPDSGVHRSRDGGETWTKLSGGLPDGNIGKIGLALSPQQPDVIYAALELDRRTGGVYRSTDRGASWSKRSDTVAGATGPHYYQELYASPHAFDRLYLVNNNMLVSNDGGTTFAPLPGEHKHGDDHAIAFLPDDPDYLLVGSDGGLYESFDLAANWRFTANLPVTQFYKVAVDDDAPFYNIYGGTQDNSTQGGPSRTDSIQGIRNSDWFLTLFGDGHQPATEPGNPDILYSEWQQGNLVRFDRTTGEIVYIQPQPGPGEPAERFNWDAPILVSSHAPTRLYFASQRVWRSDNRGNSWQAISGDLSRNQERLLLPVMDRQQSWDSPWDMLAMSAYNTITSLAESPLDEQLLYAGTDDGLLQVSANGGENWRQIEVGDLPGVPDSAFVNDIKADLHDADTVYVALDNHKYGDFKPYLLKSTDRGRRWQSVAGDLPERHLVWRVIQDHVNPQLLFAATEFGLYFTVDGGDQWLQLKGDVPTISFRDLAIQRRENDLVGASFGRGFYVLDDYSPLRELNAAALDSDALLFTGRPAWWYMERRSLGAGPRAQQGASFYTAPNPAFGAVFTYYLKEDLQTRKARRQAAEKPRLKDGEDTPFPGWDAVTKERLEHEPTVILIVTDEQDQVVRRLTAPGKKGLHRIAWDLRYPATAAVGGQGGFFGGTPQGFLAAPGNYQVSLGQWQDGIYTELVGARPFTVKPLREGVLPGATPEEAVAFWEQLASLQRSLSATGQILTGTDERLKHMAEALGRSRTSPQTLDVKLRAAQLELDALRVALNGDPLAEVVGALRAPTVNDRLGVATIGTMFSTSGATPMHQQQVALAEAEFVQIKGRLERLINEAIPALEQELDDAGAPWTRGRAIPD